MHLKPPIPKMNSPGRKMTGYQPKGRTKSAALFLFCNF